jgi:hypothetical protein
VIDGDVPGIAERGAAARRLGVEDGDAMPLPLQHARAADADHAGADDGDGAGFSHEAWRSCRASFETPASQAPQDEGE